MKTFVLLCFLLAYFDESHGQIPIERFAVLFDKNVTHIDSVLTKDFKCELGDIDEKNGVVTWKKGFNASHTSNNEVIWYRTSDSSFLYFFVTDKIHSSTQNFSDYYDEELKNPKYKPLVDGIENVGEYKAIVKTFQMQDWIIKKGKLASTNMSVIKIFRQKSNP